jgi:DNA topoisomerase IA
MQDAIKAVVSKLSQYEIRTADLEPARVQDLFKNLYQNLVPKSGLISYLRIEFRYVICSARIE